MELFGQPESSLCRRAGAIGAYLTDTTRGAVYDSLMLVLNDRIFEDKFGAYAPSLIKQSENWQTPLTGAASVALEVQPNPFDGTATFQWQTSVDGFVKITITDALGRLIATAYNGFSRAGIHSTQFDASGLLNGVYYARLEAEGKVVVTQIGILR